MALKMTDWVFKRVKDAELEKFIHNFAVRTAKYTRNKDQTGLHQCIKSSQSEANDRIGSTYIKGAAGE